MLRHLAIFLGGIPLLICGLGLTSLAAQQRPNVVLIVTDDQGWWDVGAYGNKSIETPVMDRLAREGVRFTHFYVSPVCTPTRATLMTGRYYQRTGAIDTYKGRRNLHLEEVTLGDMFQKQGYRTGLVGKWHLGHYMKYHPINRGFDEFFGAWGGPPGHGGHHYMDPDDLFWNKQPVRTVGYITDVLTDQAISFIQQNRDKPFFLYLAHIAPHSPFRVPDKYIEKYLQKGLPLREAQVYGMITSLDDNLGRLLETIDQVGIRQNTVVIFMSDNGGVSRSFRAGLRGQKGTVYEGGIRVPFIARWPGKFPAGATVQAMVQHIDVFPTLCELIGASLPTGRKIDGKNILSLLRDGDGKSPHEYLFHQWNRVRPLLSAPPPEQAATLDLGDQGRFQPSWAVRNARGYKLVRYLMSGWGNSDAQPELQLFDLTNDPGETNDIAAEHPGIVRELRNKFEAWFADVTRDQDYSLRVPNEVGRRDENPVPIWSPFAQEAALHGNNRYAQVVRQAHYWSEVTEAVRWKLDVVRSGRYEVILSYGCRASDAGSKIRISVGNSKIEHIVRETAGRNVFRHLVVGTLKLAKGAAILEMKPLSIVDKEVMALHGIWLNRLP